MENQRPPIFGGGFSRNKTRIPKQKLVTPPAKEEQIPGVEGPKVV